LACLIAALLICHSAAAPFDFRGKVIAIADGDTLRILPADKRARIIRLNGIDAPESGQDFGQGIFLT
jgi:micrococcal nuclease